MTARFLDLMTQLPSVQAFIRNIAGDIADRRSVVVLLPITADPDWLWSLLDAELWRRHFAVEQVELAGISTMDGPAAALGQALRVTWPSPSAPRDVAALLAGKNLPEVIVLDGIESLDESGQRLWLRFLLQWAQLSQNLPNQPSGPPVFCALLRSARIPHNTINSDARLAVHWWWGFPSTLELKLLCRLAGAESSSRRSETQWQEHLLPALAGSDIALLERLWTESAASSEQVVSCIQELAQARGWTKENLRRWGAAEFVSASAHRNGRLTEAPPGTARVLWAHGAAHATEEYGIELNPAALFVLDRKSELQHRLWRGQAELLLPALDGIRLDLCSYLTSFYGPDWPVKWFQPEHPDEQAAVRESPLACGWGYLEWLIKNCFWLQRERRWLPLIVPASRVRNSIAHYQTVSRSEYEQVLEQHKQFVEATCR